MHNNYVVVYCQFLLQPRGQLQYMLMLCVILYTQDLHFEILQLLDKKENNPEPLPIHRLIRDDSTHKGLL